MPFMQLINGLRGGHTHTHTHTLTHANILTREPKQFQETRRAVAGDANLV